MATETAAAKKKREAEEKRKAAQQRAAEKAKREKAAAAANSGDGSKESGDVSSTSGDEVTDAQKAVDQANSQKAEEIAKRASDKKPEDRTLDEIKVAGEVAVAKVKQEQYDAIKDAEKRAQDEAESNDGDEDSVAEAAAFTEQRVREMLEENTTPMARANEKEDYVLKQQLYQQAGLSAPDVLATANAAEKAKA